MGIIENYLACKGDFDCYVKVYKESSGFAQQEAYDILVKHCGCNPDMAYDVTEVGSIKLWVYLGPGRGWVGDNYKRQIDVDEIRKKWETPK
jgi:hypothetical protein